MRTQVEIISDPNYLLPILFERVFKAPNLVRFSYFPKFRRRKRHTGIPGLWTQELDSGRWTLDAGLWTLDSGLSTLGSGHWTLSLTVLQQNQEPVSDSA